MIYKILLLIGSIAAVVTAFMVTSVKPTEEKMVFTAERGFTAETLTQEAEAIVIGTFGPSRSYVDTSIGQSLVLTDWEFTPAEVLKGTVDQKITVTLQGGRAGKVQDRAADVPSVKKGQFALLYLTNVPQYHKWIPVSTSQGILLQTKGDSFKDHLGASIERVRAKSMIK